MSVSDTAYVHLGYDGQLHVREMTPDDKRWRIHLQNKLRLAQLEQRRVPALDEEEFQGEPEVRDV